MRSHYAIPIVTAAVLLASGCAQQRGGGVQPPTGDAQQAATNALATLRKLVSEQNYKTLGFASPGEVKTAALAPPLTIYNIGLDRLKSYQAGQDVNALLAPSSEIIYPVTADGQIRSSVTVVKKDNGFTTASFGNAEIVKGLSRNRGANSPDAFAVRIPAFSMYFLGNRVANRLMLTPVSEDSRLPFRMGVAVPAEDVLKAILPLARDYNGLPM
ncbi:MAG: hypothetical protein ACR2I2_10870 [Bryobacteraceae bacterium]